MSDNKTLHAQQPYRQPFVPDAACFIGPRAGMRFFQGRAGLRREGPQ